MLEWNLWIRVAAPRKALIPMSNPAVFPEFKSDEDLFLSGVKWFLCSGGIRGFELPRR
jgi:hypothetical protein